MIATNGRQWLAITCLIALAPAPANAALLARAGGYYDTDLGITWLADANLAATNAFGVSGIQFGSIGPGAMYWSTAQSWVAAMNASDGGAGYLAVNNWRLPTTAVPDPTCQFPSVSVGTGCAGSEMGHLFQVTGISAGSPGPFSNIQDLYWSGTENPGSAGQLAYLFDFVNVQQLTGQKATVAIYAWAVSPGDLLPVSSIPVPATAWLLGGALGLLGAVRRRPQLR